MMEFEDRSWSTPTTVEGVYTIDNTPDHYAVVMTLHMDASSPQEASEQAMRWRDAVALLLQGPLPVNPDGPSGEMIEAVMAERFDQVGDLGFHWHLHHPEGC